MTSEPHPQSLLPPGRVPAPCGVLVGEMSFHQETQSKHLRAPVTTSPGHLLLSLSQRAKFSTNRSQHPGTVFPSAPDDLLLLNLSSSPGACLCAPKPPYHAGLSSARHQGGMGAAVVGEGRQLKFQTDTFREVAA